MVEVLKIDPKNEYAELRISGANFVLNFVVPVQIMRNGFAVNFNEVPTSIKISHKEVYQNVENEIKFKKLI